MPITVWACPNNHEFELILSKAPADDASIQCQKCGEPAKPTIGKPAPMQWGVHGGFNK